MLQIIDETQLAHTGKVITAFAVEEWLCRRAGAAGKRTLAADERGAGRMSSAASGVRGLPLLYLWRHAGAFVLGLRDSKLPYARAWMEAMEQSGQSTAVRHSGGAAVPLDAGVVNVALIMPKAVGELDFHDDFLYMYELIRDTVERLAPATLLPVEYGEISGSYCPGDFDISIGGRKFCGLAQRRQTGAIIVQAFVLVEGKGEDRVRRAVDFYRDATGTADAETSETHNVHIQSQATSAGTSHPQVRSGSMASLSELIGPIGVTQFVQALKAEYRRRYPAATESERAEVPADELARTAAALEQRYKQAR